MSSDTLTWLLTKNTSSFLVKRNGNEFAREKFNLLNRNCRKYSGLASTKAVDISIADKKVTLTTKIEKAAKKPVKAENAVPLRKGARGGANTIRANISRNYYRRDLKKAALAKWSRLSTVAKVEKGELAAHTQDFDCQRWTQGLTAGSLLMVSVVSISSSPFVVVVASCVVCSGRTSSGQAHQQPPDQQSLPPTITYPDLAMPLSRSLNVVGSSLELRSSKTLIGSAAATCDVVILADNVLALHALLNLAADKASAKLVPFSTTKAGVCYVNGAAVPEEGAVVVNGDRVAFGDPQNVFLFELTPHPQLTAVSPDASEQSTKTVNFMQHLNDQSSTARANRTFRRTLDVLRGDRKASAPDASVVASIQNNIPTAPSRNSVSSFTSSIAPTSARSKDQLSKFLLEASTDSLLSDYVERKLKQRASRANSNQSPKRPNGRQSRDERNLAEVEKLRLSQRIREVNDVLNGAMDFQESYLSPVGSNTRRSNPRWKSRVNKHASRAGISESFESVASTNNDAFENEEDEDEELPTMMEKPASPLDDPRPAHVSASIQTEYSEQHSLPSQLRRGKSEREEQQSDASLQSIPVSTSNDSQQKASQQQTHPGRARDFFSKAMALGLNDLTRSQPPSIRTEPQQSAKNAQQKQLINQMIRLKQDNNKRQVLVRWKRGLQIQRHTREYKNQQLQEARAALGTLRRNKLFYRWRDFATTSSQVLICRLEAFQQRCNSRLVRKCWMAFYLHHIFMAKRSMVMRELIKRKVLVTRQTAFRRWKHFLRQKITHDQVGKLQLLEQTKLDEQAKLEIHLERISQRHYYQQHVQPLVIQIVRRWKLVADRRKQQQKLLRKVFAHGTFKLAQQAWRKWSEVTRLLRYHELMKKQSERQVQKATERLSNQHDQATSSLREDHANQLQKLMSALEEKDLELEHHKRQQHAEALQKVGSIFLVDSVLQQKIHNTNEHIHLQQAHATSLSNRNAPSNNPAEDPISNLSSNARFLYDLIQQLHQSLAKLAAVSDDGSSSLDPERLQHSSFLADALLRRQQSHLQAALAQLGT
ncbi:unnamed protein product [Phytophthora lilii]|uniref:Unnamed protein product n=1 Tax=Phytophthora lilii TaxID=2077276 RepID=A0A9W6TGM0_9STRA|nr:unnamed protein product [Phytophthora lilii]